MKAFELAWEVGVVLSSGETHRELREVVFRDKFSRIPVEQRAYVLRRFEALASRVPASATVTDCRDPKDDKFLALALDGRADVILSGDPDLLVLHPWRGVDILDPADFLARYGERAG